MSLPRKRVDREGSRRHPYVMATVDLNADMGESFGSWKAGDDESLLGIVTSANVACGFHAGDAVVMGQT